MSCPAEHKSEEFQYQLLRASHTTSGHHPANVPLTFRNIFCGREDEILQLERIFRRTASGRQSEKYPNLVLVGGASGAGKSSLVSKLREHLSTTEEEFFWISGKFEEQQQQHAVDVTETCQNMDRTSTNSSSSLSPDNLHPFVAIVDAFSTFCQELEEEEPETLEEVKKDILEAVGQQGSLLTYMIPSLTKVIGAQIDAGRKADQSELRRFHFLFRKFIQALGSHVRSVVLVLEDLHRADSASLELLHSLFTSHLKYVMFIGTYRSNEVDEDHRFSKWINNILEVRAHHQPEQFASAANKDSINNGTITMLGLSEMSLETVNTFVSSVLCLPPEETLALAHIIHTKTNGNIFFVTQYLLFLTEKRLLWFDIVKNLWDWDEPAIREESAVTTTLIDLIRDKMSQSEVAPKILPVASCLGARFSRETLGMILLGLGKVAALQEIVATPSSDTEILELLKKCEKEEFVENCGNKTYVFRHDAVQEAAMILHPTIIMQQIRYESGRLLLQSLDDGELDEKLFVVVNMLNVGRLRYDSVAPLEIARLNLRAAEKAKRLAAFSSAASYVESALVCLPPHSKDEAHRVMMLELCSLGAEVTGAMGKMEIMESYCNKILNRSNEYTILERLRIETVWMDSIASSGGQTGVALERCVSVLEQLGCTLPKTMVGQGIRTVTSLMHSKAPKNLPSSDIVDILPAMTDVSKAESMKLLDRAALYSYLDNNQQLFTICTTKMVRWTFKYGISYKAPAAFAMLGLILMHGMGDWNAGYLYAELAASMMRKLLAQGAAQDDSELAQALARTVLNTSFVLYWVKPLQGYQDELIEGYEAGMRTGDLENAYWCAAADLSLRLEVGKSLKVVDETCRKRIAEVIAMQRQEVEVFMRLNWQTALNLMEYSPAEGTTDLVGSAMNEQDIFDKKGSWGSKLMPANLSHAKYLLCAFLGEYEKGAKLAVEKGECVLQVVMGATNCQSNPFLRGICLYAAAAKTKNRHYRRHGQKVRSLLQTWVNKGNPNAVHRLKLLDAEHEACVGKRETAATLYGLACDSASQQGFVHDEALANERFAEFLLLSSSKSDIEDGMNRLRKSLSLYEEWGATRKVALLLSKYPDLAHDEKTRELAELFTGH